MSLCIPTYMLASALIGGGMNWWEAIVTIFIGNTVVLIPMILNGHAALNMAYRFPCLPEQALEQQEQTYQQCYVQLLRVADLAFKHGSGVLLYQMLRLWVPSLTTLPQIFFASFGLATGPAICFFLFLVIEHVGSLFKC